jgi:hypothetical protein
MNGTDHRVIDWGGATSALVKVRQGVGELRLAPGATALLEADFVYAREEWKPSLEYWVSEGRGRLELKQPRSSGWEFPGIFSTGIRYEWDLRLSGAQPIELDLELGAGKGNLKLGGLQLVDAEVELGVGELTLDLTGDWQRNMQLKVDAGVGRTTLILPPQVGVRVEVSKGLCAVNASGLYVDGHRYQNEAFGRAPITLYVRLHKGVGEINLNVVK